MSVYKEFGHLVREIESQSKRLFVDACDFGVPVKSFDDPIVKLIKSIAIDYYKLETKVHEYKTGTTQTIAFNGGVGAVLEAGFEGAVIKYVTTRREKTMIGYITVETFTTEKAAREARRIDY